MLLLLATIGVSFGGKKHEAEAMRLANEMMALAGRNQWKGVDRFYRQMEPLARKGVDIHPDDHRLGAIAARNLGNINDAYVRWKRAQAAKPNDEVAAGLAHIEANFAAVQIIVGDDFAGDMMLSTAEMPFELDKVRAIELAQNALQQQRAYSGLLPLGQYEIAGKTFDIVVGPEIEVKLE